tara:strand:- start:349 stop:729 length:381 start_codon:yes stop_codon:yes gene_type:complete
MKILMAKTFLGASLLGVAFTASAAGNPFDREPTPEMIENNKKQENSENRFERPPRTEDIPIPSEEEQFTMTSGLKKEIETNGSRMPSLGSFGGSEEGESVREVKVIINGKALEYNTGNKSYTLIEQ